MSSTFLANGKKIAIVMSEFNHTITTLLFNEARKTYLDHGGNSDLLSVYKVPGAFEIPGTVKIVLDNLDYDAIVTLGAVIRGETPHFDFISSECARGISNLSIAYSIPIIFGVLTTDDLQQALYRSSVDGSNKGKEVMEAALQTIHVYEGIKFKK